MAGRKLRLWLVAGGALAISACGADDGQSAGLEAQVATLEPTPTTAPTPSPTRRPTPTPSWPGVFGDAMPPATLTKGEAMDAVKRIIVEVLQAGDFQVQRGWSFSAETVAAVDDSDYWRGARRISVAAGTRIVPAERAAEFANALRDRLEKSLPFPTLTSLGLSSTDGGSVGLGYVVYTESDVEQRKLEAETTAQLLAEYAAVIEGIQAFTRTNVPMEGITPDTPPCSIGTKDLSLLGIDFEVVRCYVLDPFGNLFQYDEDGLQMNP